MGSPGHNVYPPIYAGVNAWLGNNPGKEVKWVMKGQNVKTEMYSCLSAEVPLEEDGATQFNEGLMKEVRVTSTVPPVPASLSFF